MCQNRLLQQQHAEVKREKKKRLVNFFLKRKEAALWLQAHQLEFGIVICPVLLGGLCSLPANATDAPLLII